MSLLSDALRRALQGGSATFELPQTVHIARDNARAVLSALFEIDVDPLLRDLPTVRALASRVDVALRDDRLVFTLDGDVQVGAAPFFLERAQASRLACGRCRGPACPHALAVALLLAWLDPTRHAELSCLGWQLFGMADLFGMATTLLDGGSDDDATDFVVQLADEHERPDVEGICLWLAARLHPLLAGP